MARLIYYLTFFSCILLSTYSYASIQKLFNPILPLKLKNAKVIISKHTFVTYLNYTDLQVMQDNLKQQIKFIANKKNIGYQSYQLLKQANYLLNNNDQLLKTITPSLRHKRGLINLGGKVSKWLFGTLDSEDGERINNILEFLRKNDNLLQDKINSQIHLAKELILSTNKSFSEIKNNVMASVKLIDNLQESINEINALNLIIHSLNNLTIKLTEIINAITFANLNKIHPSFLSLENLKFIIEKMNSLYSEYQQVNFINQHSYYQFLGIQLIYDNEKIIFLIHFPVLKPEIFTTYFLYPVMINNEIILSQKSYLYLNEKNGLYQYGSELCEEIENVYYCSNHLQSQEDCIINIILRNEAANCTALIVHLTEVVANQVTPESILFTTPKDIIITEKCSIEKHHEVQAGSYLITLGQECSCQINKETFWHGEMALPNATLIQLPSLNLSIIPKYSTKMKLMTINLETIHTLTNKINSQEELILPDIQKEKNNYSLWLLIITCILIMVISFVCIKYCYKLCYPYPWKLMFKKKEKEVPLNQIESSA